MKVTKLPYLPEGRPIVAVGDIELFGVKIIKPYYHSELPDGLRKHGDLTFAYLGEGVAVCAPESYDYYAAHLQSYPIRLIKGSRKLKSTYPGDCAYNVATVGKRMFCRVDAADETLLDEAVKKGFKIINIKQGYAKCSVCPVNENAAVSADVSFYRTALDEGIDCLLVTNSAIGLKGYDTGFFGGTAFMYDKYALSANGDLTKHPDAERIKNFLKKYNAEIKIINKGKLTDFGSLSVIITEE